MLLEVVVCVCVCVCVCVLKGEVGLGLPLARKELIKPDRDNVVLMHDFTKNEAIIEALPRIIDYGNENGYVFEKICRAHEYRAQ